ncbi:hypothetical protein MD484_g9049, partial [Candolleomyces efflorescens]
MMQSLVQMLKKPILSLQFIQDIKNSRITDAQFPKDLQEAILKPIEEVFDIDDPDIELSLNAYLAIANASEEVYRKFRALIQKRWPESGMLSYEQIRKKVQEFSRVTPIVSDMCVNSCVAYTSQFQDLNACPECGEARFTTNSKGKLIPRRMFHTLPLGPTIQALWRNPTSAKNMAYRQHKTVENLNKFVSPDGKIHVTETDDIMSGEDYLRCVLSGTIGLEDTVLMISMDGAQLYRQRQSDCWIYIWVLMDLPPELRYKKQYVIPGAVIPGPNAPKNVDSFLFPGLAHIASLQKEGLKVWDASNPRIFLTKPIVALTTADGPAMVDFSGFVGHKGFQGCREFCNIPGRRSSVQSKTYYPALLKPVGHTIEGSSHPDIDLLNHLHHHQTPGSTQIQYERRLEIVLAAENQSQYLRARRDTGVAKPSIFSGMHVYPPMPAMFPSDVMHLLGLNIPSNLLDIFRGTISCELDDNCDTWDFAVLTGDIWSRHGEIITLWRPFFAAGFDHVPTNPVEYINSGYRAQEFLIYIYDLLPALLYNVLPETYWTTFCKLCMAVKIVLQRRLTREQIEQAHILVLEFALEFETKFVQRKASRIHFVRPCIHNVTHIPSSTLRLGPHGLFSQYTMERTIGNIVEEMKQHTTAAGNASQRAIRRAQVNTVKALILDNNQTGNLSPTSPRYPQSPAGNGYCILWPKEQLKNGRVIPEEEFDALEAYFDAKNVDFPLTRSQMPLKKWGRLQLPTGDIARSVYQESKRRQDAPMRITRMVKFEHDGAIRFGEVMYYFVAKVSHEQAEPYNLAMISMAGLLDDSTLEKSSGALRVCDFKSGENLVVVDVVSIHAVVSLLPFPLMESGGPLLAESKFFVIEDFGRELSLLTESTTSLYDVQAEDELDCVE